MTALLKQHRSDTILIGGTRILLSVICLLFCLWAQSQLKPVLNVPVIEGWVSGADLFLIGCILLMMPVQLPLRICTDRQIGQMTGVLDSNDLGFLRLSNPVWLWVRAMAVQLLYGIFWLISWLPALISVTAAKWIWLSVPPDSESLLPLLGILHLLLLSFAAVWLPLRIYAASTALPLCFLKNPHRSAGFVLHDALCRTKHRTFHILARRLLYLPLILFPLTGMFMLPRLLALEMRDVAS